MTITELLQTKMYRNNQSFLARELGINRGTFRKYMNDTSGDYHFLKKAGSGYQLFTNQTLKRVPLYDY